MSRSPAQAETAQDSDRKESKARSRDLASISAPRLEGAATRLPPCARVDGLEPRMKCLPPARQDGRPSFWGRPGHALPDREFPAARGDTSRPRPVGGVNGW